MRIVRRVLGATIKMAVVVAIFIWFNNTVSNPDLMGFDPQEMGRLESAMWRSYYEGSWVQLACQTMEGGCGQYGFSWWDGSRASLHAARAALFFRKNTDGAVLKMRTRETIGGRSDFRARNILKKLTKQNNSYEYE